MGSARTVGEFFRSRRDGTHLLPLGTVRGLAKLGYLPDQTRKPVTVHRIDPDVLELCRMQLERGGAASRYGADRVRTLAALRRGLAELPLGQRVATLDGRPVPQGEQAPPPALFARWELAPQAPFVTFDRELTEGVTLHEMRTVGLQVLGDPLLDEIRQFFMNQVVDLNRALDLQVLLAARGAINHSPQGFTSVESANKHLIHPLLHYLGMYLLVAGWVVSCAPPTLVHHPCRVPRPGARD